MSGMYNPALTKAISDICAEATTERLAVIGDIIRLLINANATVGLLMKEQGVADYDYIAMNVGGSYLIPVFSEQKFVKTQGASLVTMGFKTVIAEVLQDNGPDGIIVNPFTKSCHCVLTKDILKSILQGKM